jgi:asparagine synthase (glutamine-hydrolysing)
MCGIVGFICFNKLRNKETLRKMTDALSHRGPDNSGYSFYQNENSNIGLGHRRLSILDISELGNQPMKFEHLEIIFNGEIYNFAEIKYELQQSGYIFDSHSDTEVLLKAYHKWGIKVPERLNGMFSFIIFDSRLDEIIICKDQFGIKPLYYIQSDGILAFASEVKAFKEMGDIDLKVSDELLFEYMQYRFTESESAFVKNIKIFPKGEVWSIAVSGVIRQTYSFKNYTPSRHKSETDIVEELLLDALEKQIYADVPVGFFLSGGVDSSLLVSMASKAFDRKFDTYSVSFENFAYSEDYYQNLVAKDSNTIHHNFISNHENFFDDFIFATSQSDTPHLIPNYTQIYQLAKIARNEVKILISGEGADEIFGGYHRFSMSKLFSFINDNSLLFAVKFGCLFNAKFKSYISSESLFNFYRNLMRYATYEDVTKFTNFKPSKKWEATSFNLNDLLKYDQSIYMRGLLQRVDNMTMLASIEARVPFLDQRIVEYVNQLGFNKKVGFRSRKKIIYDISKKYVPREVLIRKKFGFPLPLDQWFCSDKGLGTLKHILLDSRSRSRDFYNQDELRKIFQNDLEISKFSHSIIFPLLSLELWIRTFIEEDDCKVYQFKQ